MPTEVNLEFATNVNTELRTEYLVSGMMGTLEIGTSMNKIAQGVKASLVFAERGGTTSTFDPSRFAPGAVIMGPTSMHGQDKNKLANPGYSPISGCNGIYIELSSFRVGSG